MTGNGRATIRPGGRSPPFLIIGLIVGLCIIGFNYYKVSSQHNEMTREITLLRGRIKTLTTDKTDMQQSHYEAVQACKQKNLNLEGLLKSQEKDLQEAHELTKSAQDEVKSCKTEVDAHKSNFVSSLLISGV